MAKKKTDFKIGDKVVFGDLVGNIVGIVSKGNKYKEYQCIFADSNSEPIKSTLTKDCIKKVKPKKFGFNDGRSKRQKSGD